jgi:hypothetical protein
MLNLNGGLPESDCRAAANAVAKSAAWTWAAASTSSLLELHHQSVISGVFLAAYATVP